MELVTNITNESKFINLIAKLPIHRISEVLIAVAYADNNTKLVDLCYENKIRLTFFGRYDKKMPVSIPMLSTFINRASPDYRCYLIKEYFHPKVYWFKGHGVYIGSANSTDRAWTNNIEAGLFLTEEEIQNSGIGKQLETFFYYLRQPSVSTMLNADIYRELEKQNKEAIKHENSAEKGLVDTVTLINNFVPESFVLEKNIYESQKSDFIKEWSATLQLIREIMVKVSLPESRPDWVPSETPAGVQVDQFLHSFYYQRTKRKEKGRGRKYLYEDHFEQNKNRISKALEEEIEWWKSTATGPGGEEDFIKNRAPLMKTMLERRNLQKMTEEDFCKLCSSFHAFYNVAKYFSPKELGTNIQDEKTPLAAKRIYNYRAENGMSVKDILDYILYQGPEEHIVHRLFDATHLPEFHIPHFGRSCYGELVGWALPDKYPPRNDRTNKALRGLGHDVVVWNPSKGEEDED